MFGKGNKNYNLFKKRRLEFQSIQGCGTIPMFAKIT